MDRPWRRRKLTSHQEGARTARFNRLHGVPGRLKHAVADLLSDYLGVYVDPSSIQAAQGHYRTSPYADVYRWELHAPIKGSATTRWLACWETMTQFVRDGKKNGITLRDGVLLSK